MLGNVLGRLRRSDRVLVGAVLVGAVLRLLWVVIATRSSPNPYSDPAEFIDIALGLRHGDLPRFHGGEPTAWFGVGYPLLLAPLYAITEPTGLMSPAFGAALVNAAAGTATVAFAYVIAARWFTLRAARWAAWLLAVAPAQIMFTATAHAETIATFTVVGAFAAAGSLYRPGTERAPMGRIVLVGALIGYSALVRSPGLFLLALIPLFIVRRVAPRREVLRAGALLLAGSMVFLLPWTVRNAVQMGHYSPLSTNNAMAMCLGNNPRFRATYDRRNVVITDQVQRECMRGSPYDDARLGVAPPGLLPGVPDEAGWYRRTSAAGIGFALEDPAGTASWYGTKLWMMTTSEDSIVDAARNFNEEDWTGGATPWLEGAATLYLWSVMLLAGASMTRARIRRATPVWVTGAFYLVVPVFAVAFPHQHHTAMPFVIVMAAAMAARADRSPPAEGAAAERSAQVALQ